MTGLEGLAEEKKSGEKGYLRFHQLFGEYLKREMEPGKPYGVFYMVSMLAKFYYGSKESRDLMREAKTVKIPFSDLNELIELIPKIERKTPNAPAENPRLIRVAEIIYNAFFSQCSEYDFIEKTSVEDRAYYQLRK